MSALGQADIRGRLHDAICRFAYESTPQKAQFLGQDCSNELARNSLFPVNYPIYWFPMAINPITNVYYFSTNIPSQKMIHFSMWNVDFLGLYISAGSLLFERRAAKG